MSSSEEEVQAGEVVFAGYASWSMVGSSGRTRSCARSFNTGVGTANVGGRKEGKERGKEGKAWRGTYKHTVYTRTHIHTHIYIYIDI
jgi:hypothetical protein